MEKLKDQPCACSPKTETEANIVTSTPLMKSEVGRMLVRKQFIKNLPGDISLLQSAFESFKIEQKPSEDVKPHPFIFTSKLNPDSPKYEFHTPKTISPETMEKFCQLFDKSPKIKSKRIRF